MIRFDRNEFSGAFGDIGTDLPLLVGMILAAGLDSASVLIAFGLLQIGTALTYGIPMPVQPLKAVATIVIAQRLQANIVHGAGIAIGATMLLLTATGLLGWLARVVPKTVVRGIQFGLGLQLSLLALTNYVQSDGLPGYLLAVVAAGITVALLGNRRFPPALFVIAAGVVYATVVHGDVSVIASSTGFAIPKPALPTLDDITTGFLLLALPQVPLSLGNSILATQRIAADYFPERKFTITKIGFTYSLMNLAAPFLAGVPVCHGSGGMAGHYLFGARTGGSVVIYGALFLILGLFFSAGFSSLIHVFPLPMLGVILLFEGVALIRLLADTVTPPRDLGVAVIVGLLCAGLPYGYLIGLGTGLVLMKVLKH
ncbi:MAG: putative sulfate/molybdate transporter [Bacteroidota bacterium]